ncbi:hypothetical protein DEJ47_03370 [Streptomyces venezuelae]|uniref:Uncharacterized protein n=1 Tax=Streptomyces venezuelae TaxID=54571 RepID=A0A5P2B4X4_STRVZ|nr:hypothetical protein DEJ47_03370 [Streptomyces venezuelae]
MACGAPRGTGALLALVSAACCGIVDFTGGLLSRRIHFTVVTFLGQFGGPLLAPGVALAATVPVDSVRAVDFAWAVPRWSSCCCRTRAGT